MHHAHALRNSLATWKKARHRKNRRGVSKQSSKAQRGLEESEEGREMRHTITFSFPSRTDDSSFPSRREEERKLPNYEMDEKEKALLLHHHLQSPRPRTKLNQTVIHTYPPPAPPILPVFPKTSQSVKVGQQQAQEDGESRTGLMGLCLCLCFYI